MIRDKALLFELKFERMVCMRTNVELDDVLLQQVQIFGNFSTKKAAIQAALKEYLNVLKRQKLLALRGKVPWQGDLEALRSNRINSGLNGST